MKIRQFCNVLFFCLLLGVIAGCDSDSSNNEVSSNNEENTGKKLIGTITGNGYATKTKSERFIDSIISKAYAAPAGQPDTILVISREKEYKYAINDDGSFEVDTEDFAAGGIVVLVVNDTTKEVFGNLHLIASSTSDNLDFIDSGKMTGSIDFGTVDTSGGSVAITQTISGSDAFSSDDEIVLEQVARADNSVLLAVNQYVNDGLSTEVFARFNLGTIADITNQFSSLSGFSEGSNFQGNNFGFCGDGQYWVDTPYTDVAIYAPSTVQHAIGHSSNFTETATPSDPIASIGKNGPSANETGVWAFFDFPYIENFPEGEWTLKVGSTSKGIFRFSGAYPFDDNGKVRAPMPEVKINTDSDIVTTIEVKWFIFDGSEYKAASEDVLDSLAGYSDGFYQFSLTKTNDDEVGFQHNIEINSWNAIYDFTGNDINVDDIRDIMVSFQIGGVNNKYAFR